MARVQHVKAAKDYPDKGIKKGEMYYYAKIKTGPRSSAVIRQKEPIKPQQLTSSEYKRTLMDLQERINSMTSMDDAEDIINDLRQLGEEQQEKFDNMPEGLQQGETGQMIEERANACNEAADEFEQVKDDWDEETARSEAETEVDEEDENNREADGEDDEDDSEPDDEATATAKLREKEDNEAKAKHDAETREERIQEIVNQKEQEAIEAFQNCSLPD